jgi:O-antigen/teichoic acid export membrane protein
LRPSERRFLHSAAAAYSSQLARLVIRAGGDLILARLVAPAAFGVFGLAYGVILITGLIRDLGLPYQLVRDERRPYGTVFLWEVGAGALLTAILFFAAPLFGGLSPDLPTVLKVYALYILLDGLSVVPRVHFERELQVGRLVAPEIARGFMIAVVSIALAATGYQFWSLVAGQLAGALTFAVLVWIRARHHLHLELTLRPLPGLISSSLYLFFIALAALPVPYVSRFVLGGLLGPVQGTYWVGQFGQARDWGFRLQELVQPAFARVLYPALVGYRDERPQLFAAYRIGTLGILALETLAAYVLFFNADIVLLHILIGPAWVAAVPLLRILCFAPLADPFSRLGGEVLKTEGEDRVWFGIVVANLVCLIAFGILLTRSLGPQGIAWTPYLLLGNLVMAQRIWKLCPVEFWRLLRDLVFVYLLPLPLFLVTAWLLPPASWARFLVSVVAALACLGLYLWRFEKPFRAFFLVSSPTLPTPSTAVSE